MDAAQAGMTFKAVLDDPVMMGGKVVVPRSAAVVLQAAKVEQAGKMKGADAITLKANTLSFGGRKLRHRHDGGGAEGIRRGEEDGAQRRPEAPDLAPRLAASREGGRARRSARRRGAATGAIVSSQGTEHLKLPAETRLQFSLSAAVTVQP